VAARVSRPESNGSLERRAPAAPLLATPMQEIVAALGEGAWGLAALSAAVESGLVAALADTGDVTALSARCELSPALVERLLDVLVALGLARREGERYAAAPALAGQAGPPALDPVRAELRTTALQAADLVARARDGTLAEGWCHTDPILLQAQGAISAGAAQLLETVVLPRVDTRAPAVLDVGAGVAALSVALAQRHPAARIVALEPQEAPLALARANVARAGLDGRIALRAQRVEDLADEDAFDLAWLPLNFLLPGVPPRALATVRRALRPGGWLLLAMVSAPGEALGDALTRLRATLWGSDGYRPEQIESMLAAAGYGEVLRLPASPAGFIPMLARRPPATA
jgi:predicted O-methyltransferase YrrM